MNLLKEYLKIVAIVLVVLALSPFLFHIILIGGIASLVIMLGFMFYKSASGLYKLYTE